MDNEEKIGIVIAIIALFGGVIWNWITSRRAKSKGIAVAPIHQEPEYLPGTPDGFVVRVYGQVVATHGMLTAPLSQRQCVMYWTRVITSQGENKDQIQCVPFSVNHNQGVTQIDAKLSRMELSPLQLPNPNPMNDVHARALGVASADAQFYEIIVEPGQQVTIVGTVNMSRLTGTEQTPMVVGR